MSDAVERHCLEIDRCNQRGGRMLSIVDLIEAETIGADLAAYALAAISGGASFLVGAVPGGAGKTTVMGALLNFVPADVELRPADGAAAIRRGLEQPNPRCCHVCHEIGSGPYYAYLWGDELRSYFELPTAGHMLATNLHADTYEQARDQICGDSDVSERALQRMNLMFFLSVRRSGPGIRRRIESVWESDGRSPHRRIVPGGAASRELDGPGLASPESLADARRTINGLLGTGTRTIEQVRATILRASRT